MDKLMTLNELLLDGNSLSPKKVSIIVKYIFAHEGCTKEDIVKGTGINSNTVNRKVRELLFDNQAISCKNGCFFIRFPHHPLNVKPTSKLEHILRDLNNLQLTIVDTHIQLSPLQIAHEIEEIVKRYKE